MSARREWMHEDQGVAYRLYEVDGGGLAVEDTETGKTIPLPDPPALTGYWFRRVAWRWNHPPIKDGQACLRGLVEDNVRAFGCHQRWSFKTVLLTPPVHPHPLEHTVGDRMDLNYRDWLELQKHKLLEERALVPRPYQDVCERLAEKTCRHFLRTCAYHAWHPTELVCLRAAQTSYYGTDNELDDVTYDVDLEYIKATPWIVRDQVSEVGKYSYNDLAGVIKERVDKMFKDGRLDPLTFTKTDALLESELGCAPGWITSYSACLMVRYLGDMGMGIEIEVDPRHPYLTLPNRWRTTRFKRRPEKATSE